MDAASRLWKTKMTALRTSYHSRTGWARLSPKPKRANCCVPMKSVRPKLALTPISGHSAAVENGVFQHSKSPKVKLIWKCKSMSHLIWLAEDRWMLIPLVRQPQGSLIPTPTQPQPALQTKCKLISECPYWNESITKPPEFGICP